MRKLADDSTVPWLVSQGAGLACTGPRVKARLPGNELPTLNRDTGLVWEGVRELTVLRLCLMRAASRRLASPFTPPCSLVSHQSVIWVSRTVSLPSTSAASSVTQELRIKTAGGKTEAPQLGSFHWTRGQSSPNQLLKRSERKPTTTHRDFCLDRNLMEQLELITRLVINHYGKKLEI